MHIEFVNLKRQNHLHQEKYFKIINKIILTAQFSLGEHLKQFEIAFAKFCGTKYCVGVDSGTSALELILRAYGVGPGDEVIIAANTYISTAMVVTHVGATPILADAHPQTFTLDPEAVERVITSKTRAIIAVHLCGQPADMDPLMAIAKKHKILIVEDCCQAHGAKYKGKIVPITGLGAFSFYPGKNLGGFGDGGAIVVNDSKIASRVRLLRNDGSIKKYYHEIIGYKSRLDTIQAAILSTKLKYLNGWNTLRRRHARTYTSILSCHEIVKTPVIAPYSDHVFHLYVIQVPKRNQLQKYLFGHGIDTVIHYPTPIHLQPAYKSLGYMRGNFPVTESLAKAILSLPMFPELTTKEIKYVCQKIVDFYER